MRFRPLKRVPAPAFSDTAELVEPSAGALAAFSEQIRLLPELEAGTGRVPLYHFNMYRVLVCLHENGKPLISQLVNYLNSQYPERFPFSVQEDVSIRQTFEDLSHEQWALIMDWTLDNFPGTLLQELSNDCEKVWGEPETKN